MTVIKHTNNKSTRNKTSVSLIYFVFINIFNGAEIIYNISRNGMSYSHLCFHLSIITWN